MRFIILITVGLLLCSWFLPWWHCDVILLSGWLEIRPWALQHNMQAYVGYMKNADMPGWFAPAMWTYLAICVLALIASLFLQKKYITIFKHKMSLTRFIVGFFGISYTVVVILAVIIAAIRTGDFYGTKLIGRTFLNWSEYEQTWVVANLQFGYWLACGVALLALLVGIFYNKIVGISKSDSIK
jgi:hypothetical protein